MPSPGSNAHLPDKRAVPLPEDLYVRLVMLADERDVEPGRLLESIINAAIPAELEVHPAEDGTHVSCRCCLEHGHCRRPFRWRDQIRCGCGR